MTLYREWKGKHYPAQLKGGKFVLGDPALGKTRHRAANPVNVGTETEAANLVRKGFYLRVAPEKGTRATLVRLNLFQNGTRLT